MFAVPAALTAAGIVTVPIRVTGIGPGVETACGRIRLRAGRGTSSEDLRRVFHPGGRKPRGAQAPRGSKGNPSAPGDVEGL
jgi:hypothetical protein